MHVATHEEMGHRRRRRLARAVLASDQRTASSTWSPPTTRGCGALVSKAFTPRMVEGCADPIQRMMDGLVDGVAGAGSSI